MLSSFAKQINRLPSSSSGIKSVRVGSIALSLLLNLAVLGALFLSPVGFSASGQKVAMIDTIEADLALAENRMKHRSNGQAKKFLPKTKNPLPKSQRPFLKNEAKPSISTSLPVVTSSQLVSMSKVKAVAVPTNVSDLVRELLASSQNAEPMDFQSLNNVFLGQLHNTDDNVEMSLLPDSAAGGGLTCDTTETVKAALQEDETLKAALLEIPRGQRSVANVIMVWDGTWKSQLTNQQDDAQLSADLGLPTLLKTQIEGLIRTISPECAIETVSGPVFILIEGGAEPIILTIGSGTWQWRNLLGETPSLSSAMFDGLQVEFQEQQRQSP